MGGLLCCEVWGMCARRSSTAVSAVLTNLYGLNYCCKAPKSGTSTVYPGCVYDSPLGPEQVPHR